MTIEFDNELYSAEAIEQATFDYKDIAFITSKPTVSGIQCVIEKSAYDIELTKLEFCNYVLTLSVSIDGKRK